MVKFTVLEDVFDTNGPFERLRFGSVDKEIELEEFLLEYAGDVNSMLRENKDGAMNEVLKLEQVLIELSSFISDERPWLEEMVNKVYARQIEGIELWEDE